MKSFAAATILGLTSAFEFNQSLPVFFAHMARYNKSYEDH
jgi:hypothetical protein